MIQIEHGALRAFEEHALAGADGIVEQDGGVAHQRPDAFGESFILGAHARVIVALEDAKRARDDFFFADERRKMFAEVFRIQQLGHANAAPPGLVLIDRADAARGGADAFQHFFHRAMSGQQHMRAIADAKLARDGNAGGFERIDFAEQRGGIDHQAIADHGQFPRPQNAAGNQLQDEFLVADDYGMAGVVPALVARHEVETVGEQIDDLALAFISPLRS